jgi:hypothetical protein
MTGFRRYESDDAERGTEEADAGSDATAVAVVAELC